MKAQQDPAPRCTGNYMAEFSERTKLTCRLIAAACLLLMAEVINCLNVFTVGLMAYYGWAA